MALAGEVLRRVADSRQHEIRETSAELSEVKDTLVGTRRVRTNILRESWKIMEGGDSNQKAALYRWIHGCRLMPGDDLALPFL